MNAASTGNTPPTDDGITKLLNNITDLTGNERTVATRELYCAIAKSDPFSLSDIRKRVCESLGIAIRQFDELLKAARRELAGSDDAETEPVTQSALLVAIAAQQELFHWRDDPYALVALNGHNEAFKIGSAKHKKLLRRSYYSEYGKVPSRAAIDDAVNTMAGHAEFDGEELPVSLRIGTAGRSIFVDLGSDDGAVVRLSPQGLSSVNTHPVRFRRPRGMASLPRPVHGGSVDDLRQFVNITDDSEFRLLLCAITAYMLPRGPYPVMVITGEQGAGKSMTCRRLRNLIDPNVASLRAFPRSARDLMIAANNCWVLAFDNASFLPPWLSDALCRISSGGGFTTRELYENDEEIIIDVSRPITINSIEDFVDRGDLLDRTLVFSLTQFQSGTRKPEAELNQEFELALPRVLGALYDIVCVGLQNYPNVHLDEYPRMADFARWMAAIAPALGCTAEELLGAYAANQKHANLVALEATPVARCVHQLVSERNWEGTSTELLRALLQFADDATRRSRGWPKNAARLSGVLRRIAPNLRTVGVDVTFHKTHGSNSRRLIRIARLGRESGDQN